MLIFYIKKLFTMKNLLKALFYFFVLIPLAVNAQDNWAVHLKRMPTKGYEGHKFKLQSMIKVELEDDSAKALLWTRVDKQNGSIGFFDNMEDKPIRNNVWKNYIIEGIIDETGVRLNFGISTHYNGTFYCDDLTLDIEIEKGKWVNVFKEDFEQDTVQLKKSLVLNSPDFSAEILKGGMAANGNGCFKIVGKNVPNYGINKKVGKYADVNGIKLYYEIYGEGQPLVVLHGNGGSIESASAHYAELIKKYKVIAIDSRAQGKSSDTDQPLTYDVMASDVNALLEQLGIDSVNIWGQSDGAILGLLLAMDYPKKVRRVLAFGANIQPDSLAIFSWAINSDLEKIKTTKDDKEKKLLVLMQNYPNIPYLRLAQIKAPVLIMAGDRDVIRPEHTLKLFQNIPNSQMCILPGTTHGASWNKKELFLQLLYDFFDKPFEMPDIKDWYKN